MVARVGDVNRVPGPHYQRPRVLKPCRRRQTIRLAGHIGPRHRCHPGSDASRDRNHSDAVIACVGHIHITDSVHRHTGRIQKPRYRWSTIHVTRCSGPGQSADCPGKQIHLSNAMVECIAHIQQFHPGSFIHRNTSRLIKAGAGQGAIHITSHTGPDGQPDCP